MTTTFPEPRTRLEAASVPEPKRAEWALVTESVLITTAFGFGAGGYGR